MLNELELSKKTIFSFEVFPPKKDMPINTIFSTLDELKGLNPDFISVTFGAGGSSNSGNSIAIAKRIKEVCKVEHYDYEICRQDARNGDVTDDLHTVRTVNSCRFDHLLVYSGDGRDVHDRRPSRVLPSQPQPLLKVDMARRL